MPILDDDDKYYKISNIKCTDAICTETNAKDIYIEFTLERWNDESNSCTQSVEVKPQISVAEIIDSTIWGSNDRKSFFYARDEKFMKPIIKEVRRCLLGAFKQRAIIEEKFPELSIKTSLDEADKKKYSKAELEEFKTYLDKELEYLLEAAVYLTQSIYNFLAMYQLSQSPSDKEKLGLSESDGPWNYMYEEDPASPQEAESFDESCDDGKPGRSSKLVLADKEISPNPEPSGHTIVCTSIVKYLIQTNTPKVLAGKVEESIRKKIQNKKETWK